MKNIFKSEKIEFAQAIISSKNNEISKSNHFLINKCNDSFTELTGLTAGSDSFLEVSSDIKACEACGASLIRCIKDNKKDYLILKFTKTGKYLYTKVTPESESTIKLLCVDFTSIQRQLDSFKFQERGYSTYIKNFHGMAFQRLLKPEIKSIFTAGAYEDITGYTSDQAKNFDTWKEIIHPDDKEWVAKEAEALYNDTGYKKDFEYRIIRRDGSIGWLHTYDCNFLSEDGTMQMVQGLIVDVTAQKQQELKLKEANRKIQEQNKKLERMSMTDYLTGLSNRRFAQQVLNYLIHNFKRTGETFSLLMIDLDHFKKINDKYGHYGGDAVLTGVSKILKESLREIDIKARWGGEEFLVILPRTTCEDVDRIAWKLLRKVRETVFEYNNINIKVTFSGGVSTYDKAVSMQMALHEADEALYQAKDKGRDQIISLKT